MVGSVTLVGLDDGLAAVDVSTGKGEFSVH
jgi:hypothetical protein